MNCEQLSGLKWYTYVATCVIGGVMALCKANTGLKAYGECAWLASIYLLFALWFASGPVVSGVCLGMHHNEDCEEPVDSQCQVRMKRFIYVYSIVVSVMVALFLVWIMPKYWYEGSMCRLGLFIAMITNLAWMGCAGALLDVDPILCNAPL